MTQCILVVTLLLISATLLSQETTAHPEPPRSLIDLDYVDDESNRAPPPVAIQIGAIGVNSPVETQKIIDGKLAAPSGPWVVAWYLESARPGESGNVVMGGHVDYWTTGPAVFFSLRSLREGEAIELTDASGGIHYYAVEWVRTYSTADITSNQLREIVGPTEDPSLTLITCGGAFDRDHGQYLMRLIVRATRVNP